MRGRQEQKDFGPLARSPAEPLMGSNEAPLGRVVKDRREATDILSKAVNRDKAAATGRRQIHPAQMAVPKKGFQLQSRFNTAVLRELGLGRRVVAVGGVVTVAMGASARGIGQMAPTAITWR